MGGSTLTPPAYETVVGEEGKPALGKEKKVGAVRRWFGKGA